MPGRQVGTDERGATLVEFAIVMPLLILVMVSIVEVGVAIRDRFVVGSAVADGVRVTAFQGNHPDADCTAVTAMAAYLGSEVDRVERVEIFKADSNGNQIPGSTNSYLPGAGDPTDCTSWIPDVKWASTSRQVFVGSQPLDIVGVRVQYRRPWLTGFPPFTGDMTIDDSAVSRVEPEAFE